MSAFDGLDDDASRELFGATEKEMQDAINLTYESLVVAFGGSFQGVINCLAVCMAIAIVEAEPTDYPYTLRAVGRAIGSHVAGLYNFKHGNGERPN